MRAKAKAAKPTSWEAMFSVAAFLSELNPEAKCSWEPTGTCTSAFA
jgi:hypothetical protein